MTTVPFWKIKNKKKKSDVGTPGALDCSLRGAVPLLTVTTPGAGWVFHVKRSWYSKENLN